MASIEEEIQQESFKNEKMKAVVNIMYTASYVSGKTGELLKPYGLTVQQFNVLRILKGQKGKPASVKLLTQRMVDKMSNASRLVDKLVAKDLVTRVASDIDRRQVDVLITKKGLKVVTELSESIDAYYEDNLPLTDEEFVALNTYLDRMRD